MDLQVTRRQRDLLYECVTDRLTGIDDVWWAVEAQRWTDAEHYAREFADFLQLLLNGLGWGSKPAEATTLRVPPDVLRRTLETIRSDASVESAAQRDLRLQVAEAQIERQDTLDACEELLAKLVD